MGAVVVVVVGRGDTKGHLLKITLSMFEEFVLVLVIRLVSTSWSTPPNL